MVHTRPAMLNWRRGVFLSFAVALSERRYHVVVSDRGNDCADPKTSHTRLQIPQGPVSTSYRPGIASHCIPRSNSRGEGGTNPTTTNRMVNHAGAGHTEPKKEQTGTRPKSARKNAKGRKAEKTKRQKNKKANGSQGNQGQQQGKW